MIPFILINFISAPNQRYNDYKLIELFEIFNYKNAGYLCCSVNANMRRDILNLHRGGGDYGAAHHM